MQLSRPNGGMFGIKLVGHNWRHFPFHGRKGTPAVMNYPDSPAGKQIATGVPIGHRSFVYLMAPDKRIWSVVEYIKGDPSTGDFLEEGRRAAKDQGAIKMIEAIDPHFAKIWRCVRVVAEVEINHDMTPAFDFHQGDVMFDIDENDYVALFNAIPWTWKA